MANGKILLCSLRSADEKRGHILNMTSSGEACMVGLINCYSQEHFLNQLRFYFSANCHQFGSNKLLHILTGLDISYVQKMKKKKKNSPKLCHLGAGVMPTKSRCSSYPLQWSKLIFLFWHCFPSVECWKFSSGNSEF